MKTKLALILLAASLSVKAERVLLVPPVVYSSVHAGVVSGVTCISAGMLKADNYPGTTGGVGYGAHVVNLTLQNIANIEANVKVVFLAGSGANGSHTNGSANVWPSFAGGKLEFTQQRVIQIKLRAKDIGSVGVQYNCKSTECQAHFFCGLTNRETESGDCNLTQASTLNGPPYAGVCGSDGQVCISMSSKSLIEIHALEDRGALLGSVTSTGHRCAGFVDHFTSPPLVFQINGGKPF